MLTASGKRMHSLGEVDLKVNIGNLRTVQKFIVASPLNAAVSWTQISWKGIGINLDFGNRVLLLVGLSLHMI